MTALKNQIDQEFIENLAQEIYLIDKKFNKKIFIKKIIGSNWNSLELKQRIRLLSTTLKDFLPGDFKNQVETLKKVVPKTKGLGMLLFPDFVELYGENHWDISIEALRFLTPYVSAEFAIRVFIKKDPKKIMPILLKWSKDKNHHIRRLASEGSRSRLPWSFKIEYFIKNPLITISILENLKKDESLYVRKSVANHLNDISKDHPEIVLKLAQKWIGQSEHTNWILKHGLRTLLKKGNQKALKLFGVAGAAKIDIKKLNVVRLKNPIGSKLEFVFDFHNKNTSEKMLRVEYAIHYLKKNKSHSKKVFKITEKSFSKGYHIIRKEHSLRQMSTRTHNPGEHQLDVIINGEIKASTKFIVVK